MRKIAALMLALAICLPYAARAENARPGNAVRDIVSTLPTKSDSKEILTRLPNGLLVYILKDTRFPLTCTRLYVRTGSANEDPKQAGISHLLEHMVFKGTEHRPRGQVAKDVEALGGYLNAATSFDRTWYIADMPAKHWRTGISVVKDMAFGATLDAAELEAEKNVVISELERGEDSPMRKLYENLQVAALAHTPYGRPIIGYVDTIRSVTAQDLRNYVKRWYQPQNMMLMVAGDIEPLAVLSCAQELFGDLRNTSDLAVQEAADLATAPGGSKVGVDRGPWSKVYLGIAWPVPGYKDLRSVDLDILSYLMGGDATSLLYKKYKYDLQMVESISVDNMSLARAGLLTITARLDPAKTGEFWSAITKDLADLSAKAFSDDGLKRARLNLEDSMDRAGETLNGLTAWKGTVQFDLGGEQGEENLRFTQQNVDMGQIEEAIGHWLNPAMARVRVLAPENAELPDFAGIMEKNWPPRKLSVKMDWQADMGNRETVDLDNGCQVVLIPDATVPYISLDLLMPGGNAMLKPDQQGLAELTARLLTDGSGDLDAQAMERWLSERAASMSASAGLQTFGIALTGPSRFESDYFDILRHVLLNPRLAPAELAREVNNMKAAISMRKDNPLSYMFSRITPFLFPDGQPYGYERLGDPDILDKLNVVDVRNFWTMQSGQPWILAIAGSFNREKALEFAKSLPKPRVDKFEWPVPHWGKEKDLRLTLPGRNQAHLMQIFETVPPTDPDAPAMMLLQAVLSGQSGLLFSDLRDEQGLGYTVTAFNRSMPKTGFMAFYIGTTPDRIEKSRQGFAKIIEEIKAKPLAEDLLKAGANRLLGDWLREQQSLGARAGEAATDGILHYPPNFRKKLIDEAALLTPADLQEVARKYLRADNLREATLLP